MISATRVGSTPAELLYRRLESYRPIAAEEARRLAGLGDQRHDHPAGAQLKPATQGGSEAHLVVSGVVAEARMLTDGRRQIVMLRIPGDLLTLTTSEAGSAVLALTATRTIDATPFLSLLSDPSPSSEGLRTAWALALQAEHRATLDHVVRLGRLSAYERMGHLLLELHERLLRVDLATSHGFHLPITQETLADVLGLSIVHVNRTLQQLRRDGLLNYRAGHITFPDRDRLAAVAGYAIQIATPSPPAANPMSRRLVRPGR